MRRHLAGCLAALLSISVLLAWGQNGHRIVGRIAQGLLSQPASSAVDQLLQGQSLAQVSNWADEIRSIDRWNCADPFHYVTVPLNSQYPDPESPQWEDGDAIRAVIYLADRMSRPELGENTRRDALRFLVHVVGDLHQPLHVGRGCDRGGNDLTVLWFSEERRLHSVWDAALIESENLSFTEYTEFLGLPSEDEIVTIQTGGPHDWIAEAQQLHRDVYRCDTAADRCPCFCGNCDDGLSEFGGCGTLADCRLQINGPVRLAYAYKTRVKPALDQRLRLAGIRLAALLNAVLGEQPGLPPAYRALRAELDSIPGWNDALSRCFTNPN